MVRAILSLFDGKKKLYIEEMGRHVEVASGVVLFCTDSCHPKDVSPLFNVCDETVFLDEPQGEDLINLILIFGSNFDYELFLNLVFFHLTI